MERPTDPAVHSEGGKGDVGVDVGHYPPVSRVTVGMYSAERAVEDATYSVVLLGTNSGHYGTSLAAE